MKPHIKVIQRNGVDVFVTSSMKMKPVKMRSTVASSDIMEAQHKMNVYYAGLASAAAMGPYRCNFPKSNNGGFVAQGEWEEKPRYHHVWNGEYKGA